MSAVPSLDEQRSAHLERRRRLGLDLPNLVAREFVRPDPEPEPEPEPEPQHEPAPDVVQLPSFLGLRARRSDWFDLTNREAFKPATATAILRTVSIMTRVPLLDIISERKPAPIAKARMIACWIMRHFTSMSLPAIGRKLGGRDHSTIAHSVRRVEAMRAKDPVYAAYVDNIVLTVMQAMQGEGE